jgi:hypothetical protein
VNTEEKPFRILIKEGNQNLSDQVLYVCFLNNSDDDMEPEEEEEEEEDKSDYEDIHNTGSGNGARETVTKWVVCSGQSELG